MGPFARILGAQLRRERWMLPIWLIGIALLGFAASSAVATEFGEEGDRAAIVAVAALNPAFLFIRGLPDGFGVGSVVFFQAYTFTAVLAGLMSTFLVVRHTRADEELGRAELLGATPIGRATPLAVTITLGVAANLALAVMVALGFLAAGLPLDGALVAGAAVGSVGLVFVGVAAVVAQVLPSGRGANGFAASLVGLAYFARAVGDALGEPNAGLSRVIPAWLSLLSPIGWGQATRPFTEPTYGPLMLSLAAFIVLGAAALALRTRRDLGSSLVPERRGPATAGFGGRSVLGLAWRLQRPALLGWCLGGVAFGLISGGLGPVVADAVAGNSSLADLIGRLAPGGSGDIVDVFTAALLGMAGVLAGAAGLQAVVRLRSEEAEGRAELLLATPTSRHRWLGVTLLVALVSALAVCLAAGATTGIGVALATADASQLARFTGAGLAHAPAALVFVALTALVLAVLPRLTSALGWGLLVAGLVLGQFGELLGLPGWLQDVSPYRHTAAVPVETFDSASALALVAVAGVIAVAAVALIRRRDLAA